MRVLFLTCHLPYPPVSGGRLREHELLRRLCRACDVHLVAISKTYEQDLAAAERLEDLCASVTVLEARAGRPDEVDALVGEWTRAHPKADLWRALEEARVPAGPVADIPELLVDPQLRQRGMVAPVEHPTAGTAKGAVAAGLPLKFSRAHAALDRPAPSLGQDNARIYSELLGYTREQLADLRARGVI
jgi:crotonobetainyl-CoA:carnitine CoA-transferase CaiB-like acyl-CoA transferase